MYDILEDLEVEMETIAVLTLRRIYSRPSIDIDIKLLPRHNCAYQVDMDYI